MMIALAKSSHRIASSPWFQSVVEREPARPEIAGGKATRCCLGRQASKRQAMPLQTVGAATLSESGYRVRERCVLPEASATP